MADTAPYTDEQAFEAVLKEASDVLPGSRGEGMALARQLQISATAAADLVGVEPSGKIVLVECKLRRNPEIRREVVGQLFAYAAALWKLSYEAFDAAFARAAGGSLVSAIEGLLAGQGHEDWSEEAFRAAVAKNLAAGSFRLVFALDEITDELRDIVLYLNGHTVQDVEVFALELAYLRDRDVEILVPNVYGGESVAAKAVSTTAPWTADSYFGELARQCATSAVLSVRQLYEWAAQHGAEFVWAKSQGPSVTAKWNINGRPVSCWRLSIAPGSAPALELDIQPLRSALSATAFADLCSALQSHPATRAALIRYGSPESWKYPSLRVEGELDQAGVVDVLENALSKALGLEGAPAA